MENNLNAFFGAMADPTRRAVIETLVSGPRTVSDLHAPHNMALPTFMKHLSKLQNAGLIRSVKKGRVRTIHIEAAPMKAAEDWITRQRQMWTTRLDRLALLAETTTQKEIKNERNNP